MFTSHSLFCVSLCQFHAQPVWGWESGTCVGSCTELSKLLSSFLLPWSYQHAWHLFSQFYWSEKWGFPLVLASCSVIQIFVSAIVLKEKWQEKKKIKVTAFLHTLYTQGTFSEFLWTFSCSFFWDFRFPYWCCRTEVWWLGLPIGRAGRGEKKT